MIEDETSPPEVDETERAKKRARRAAEQTTAGFSTLVLYIIACFSPQRALAFGFIGMRKPLKRYLKAKADVYDSRLLDDRRIDGALEQIHALAVMAVSGAKMREKQKERRIPPPPEGAPPPQPPEPMPAHVSSPPYDGTGSRESV